MGVPILQTLWAAGLTLTARGDELVVAPRNRLTDELRQVIREHKPEILGALAEAEADDRRHCATCWNLRGARCESRGLLVMDDLPRRCFDYTPTPDDPDQRPGRDRWPSMNPEVQP